jgi:TP901 family phage tail tape measure protein
VSRKLYEIAFEIGGKIQNSLRTSVMTAAGQLESLDRRIRELDSRKMHGPGFDAYNSKIDSTISKLKGLKSQIRETEGAIQANQNKRANLRGQIIDTASMAAALVAPIKAAASFETAMLGVAKQVQGARDEGGKLTPVYFAMARQIQQMGREIPLATNEIADMVAAGARMGVARDELIKFTKTSAMMASAFELPAGQLAEQMGKIAGLYKIPIPAIGELADTINYLDDNAIAKGGDIIDFLTRTGGVAGAVKITGQQMAALGSTLLTMGERSETASTATNAMLQKFAAAEKGTAKFQSAMQELGISSAYVQKSMQADAMGTILQVLDKISSMPKDKQLGIMVDLIGLEHSDTLAKLANNTAEFRKQIEMAASAEARGSMSREFQAQRETTAAQYQIMKNNVSELAVSFGTVLLPGVNAVFAALAKIIQPVAELSRQYPVATKTVVGLAVGLGALKVAALAAGYAGTFFTGGFLMMSKVLLMAKAGFALMTSAAVAGRVAMMASFVATKLMASGVFLLNAVMAANPIILMVAAIAALVSVGVLLYKNWDILKAKALQLWNLLPKGFRDSVNSVTSFLGSIDLAAIGSAIMQTMITGIKAKSQAVVDAVKEAFAKVREYMPFSDAKRGPLSQLTASGKAIVSTLADGVSSAPENAIAKQLQSKFGVVQDGGKMGSGLAVQGMGQKSQALSGGQGVAMSISYSPQIVLPAGSPEQTRQAADQSLAAGIKDFERKMRDIIAQQNRTSYA